MAKKDKAAAEAGVPVVRVPWFFRGLRWFIFLATIAIAIGMLVLMNHNLTGISWVYDGSLTQYTGKNIKIQYCMFSSSTDASQEGKCNFAYAVASVSLVLSFVWSYMQAMRRNPFKHPRAKLADVILCTIWMLFWLAAAIVLCVWANAANKTGSFLHQARDARNGYCVMACVEFLLVAVLTVTAGMLFSPNVQNRFDRWEEKKKQRKLAKEQHKMERKQARVAQQDAAAVAAKQAAAHPTPTGPAAGPAAHSTAGAPAGATMGPAAPSAAPAVAPTAGPTSAPAMAPTAAAAPNTAPVAAPAAPTGAGAGATATPMPAGGGDNPFR